MEMTTTWMMFQLIGCVDIGDCVCVCVRSLAYLYGRKQNGVSDAMLLGCVGRWTGVGTEQRLQSESSSGAREWCYSDSTQRPSG